MVRSLSVLSICFALIVRPAFADDPRLYQPPAPESVGYPNWVLTPDGKAKLDETLNRQFVELVQLRTENSELRETLVEWEAKPALTWKGGLLLVGAGVVLGLAVGIPVALAVR